MRNPPSPERKVQCRAHRGSELPAVGLLLAAMLLLRVGEAAEKLMAPFPGLVGAVTFPVEMPLDGKATLALYSPNGQLIRILAQAVPLAQGRYLARWDGMDLWGHLLPPGTHVEAKLMASPGVRVFYEFAAAEGDRDADYVPWLTSPVGTGLTMRTGGWLGDHTGPGAVAAIGDKVFLGSRVVEHGHPLIACDLEGRKLWGGRLSGWDGPSQLFALEGWVVARVKQVVWRIDPETYRAERMVDTSPLEIRALGTAPGKLLAILHDPSAEVSVFRFAWRHEDIRFDAAWPRVTGNSAPEFQLPPTRRFSTVFCSEGGHFQTGLEPVAAGGSHHVLVPLREPKKLGTLVFEQIPGIANVEIYGLRRGVQYEPSRHDPVAGMLSQKGTVAMPGEPGADWVTLASVAVTSRLVTVPLRADATPTGAIYLRFLGTGKAAAEEKVSLRVCRALERRAVAEDRPPEVRLPPGAMAVEAIAGGWRFRLPEPPSDEKPAQVVLDFGRPSVMDGLLMLNQTSTKYAVDVLTRDFPPANADEADWRQVIEFQSHFNRKEGHESASTLSRTTFLDFRETVTTRAVRFRVFSGYGRGKVALKWTEDDPARIECELCLPLKLLDGREKVAPHRFRVYRFPTGDVEKDEPGDYGEIRYLAGEADGTVYATVSNVLTQAQIGGGTVRHLVLNDRDLRTPFNLQIWQNQLVVGDRGAVRFFDRTGRLVRTLGAGEYRRGLHDRNRMGLCTGVAIDRKGKIWIAEEAYSPKRVARFNLDGQCEKEFFGPPQYGGGGWLAPDLKSFYYRGMEFALDWERGTSRLWAFNDRPYTEETPTLDASTFAYTQVGRPIEFRGRRYVVGDPGRQFSPGVVVCLLEGPVWRPCAVIGRAQDSPFLLRKEVWKDHWRKQDLSDRLFIWVDRNDDGAYQIEEVDLFRRQDVPGDPTDGGYWGSRIGPDLTVWTPSARLAPRAFTPGGAPIYDRRDIQGFRYADLAPFYPLMQTSTTRAHSQPSVTPFVASDGSLSLGTQPYRVLSNLTIAGGPVRAQPTEYLPPIVGKLMREPLHCAGTAVTRSPVGEVAMLVGDSGIWSILAVRDCVMVDQIFTGEDGHWSTDLPARRGVEVTRRRHDPETFFGHFIRATNGRDYVVCGKGFHAICRVEGLDDLRVSVSTVSVDAASHEANAKLRVRLREEAGTAARIRQRKTAPECRAVHISRLKSSPKVDGVGDEWSNWIPLDPPQKPEDPPATTFFAAAWDEQGLYLAFRGHSYTGNRCDDPRFLFASGFALEFCYSTNVEHRPAQGVAGDRRLVLGRYRGDWIAVLYDYVNPSVSPGQEVKFESPVLTTVISEVRTLPSDAVRLAWRPDDLSTPGRKDSPYGGEPWVSEWFLPWSVLGFASRPSRLPCDVGVMIPDSGGRTVVHRLAWANPGPLPVSDVAYEARIEPDRWGVMVFE